MKTADEMYPIRQSLLAALLLLPACSGQDFTLAAVPSELDAQETGTVDIQISITHETSLPEAASVGDSFHSPLDASADATPGDEASPDAGDGSARPDVSEAGPRYEAGPFTVAAWPCPDQPILPVGRFYFLIVGMGIYKGAPGPVTVFGDHCDVSSVYEAPTECRTAETFVCACLKDPHPCADVDGRPFLLEGDIGCSQPNAFNAKCYGP